MSGTQEAFDISWLNDINEVDACLKKRKPRQVQTTNH